MTAKAVAQYRMLEQIRNTGWAVREALGSQCRATLAESAQELLALSRGRLYTTGCGTSFHAAAHARYAFRHLAGIEATAVSTSDLLQLPPADLGDVPLLAYSHSGVSKATVDAARAARDRCPQVVAVLNVDGTPLSAAAGRTLVVPGGRDTALAKTKSFTTTMLVNVLLGIELGRRSGYLDAVELERWEGKLAHLPAMIDAAVGLEERVADYVGRVGSVGSWFFVGSHVNALIAAEAALKMKEANYAIAEGYETEEAGHGRIQPVDETTMGFAFATVASLDERLLDIVRALKATGARVTLVAPRDESALSAEADEVVTVPCPGHPLLTSLVNVIPAQLLAYELAVARGYDPDLIRTDIPRYARANGIVFPPGTH